jgi:hypothetical protein
MFSPRQFEAFRDLLIQSPGLWPLSLVVAEVGVEKAIEACRDPSRIPAKVQEELAKAGYSNLDHVLPSADDVRALVVAIVVQHQRAERQKPLKTIARDMGVALKYVQRCLRLLATHQATPGVRTFLHQGPCEAVGL